MPLFVLMRAGVPIGRSITNSDGVFTLNAPGSDIGAMLQKIEVVASHPIYAKGRIAIGTLASDSLHPTTKPRISPVAPVAPCVLRTRLPSRSMPACRGDWHGGRQAQAGGNSGS